MKKRQDMPGTDATIPPAEMQHIELQARQLDLEIQNEELLQARDLLEASRDRYVDFYDFSPVGYLTLSDKALITEINLTGAVMLGEERSNLRRRRFAEFLALEDNDFWNRHFMAVRQHEEKQTCELRILRGDGSRMDVQIDSLRLARDGQESVVRLALSDITERKRAEAALRASEEQRRLLEQQKIIQTSLDGFWVARVKDARILEANEAFCNMVGYTRAELLAMSIYDLEAEESPVETAEHIKRIMEVGSDRFETRHRHKQGHLIDLEASVSYSESDGGVHFVFVRNITERKLAEQYERFRSRILELLSGGDALPDILEGIVRGVEQLSPGMICSILLLEGNRLGHGIAPSLPDFYNAASEGIEIGIGVGSCGTAAASGERVIVADIQTHPYWAFCKELALKAGLGACWSQPILSSAGQVLGTFAIYHREAHTPTAFDISIIEQAAYLASIAIERKQAEALLVQREREFRTLAENMPDTLIRYDREGRRTYINPALRRISAVRDEQMLGLTQQESNPFKMPETYRLALERALASGEHSEIELEIPTPSGDIRTNLVSIAAERAEDGQISGAITIGHDITERKQAETLLMQRERELRTFAENMPDNIVRYNREGATVYVNPALERTLGDLAGAMIGTTPREYHPDGSYEDYAQLLDSVLASGEAGELEKILPAPDGKDSVHQIRMVPERGENGEVIGVLSIGRDITEYKRSEEALRASEQQFRTLAENLPDILIRYDREGRRTYVNPAQERLFAVASKQTLGLTPEKANPMHLSEAYQLALKHTLATGERGEFEMELLAPSGAVRTGFICIAAERAEDGKICGAITIGRDITKLKQTEQQLRELTVHLQTVREEEKARLAREIHDDLGSTLAALKLKLSHFLDFELAEEMSNTPLFARLESMSFILENAIAATRRIVTDMRPDVLDNLGLFAALKWQAEQFHKHTGIMCRIVCANDCGCVDCLECASQLDKAQSINLFRIFQEALTNVARHSGAASVVAEYRPEAGHVLLSISDDGCGLPEGHVQATTSFGIRGMRERVGQLGGQIAFDNALGGGLCVKVRLPFAADNKGGAENPV